MKLLKLLPVLLLMLYCRIALAGSRIDGEWNRLINDKAFGYKDQTEALQKTEPPAENIFSKVGEVLLDFFTSPAGKLIGWLVFFSIVGWALYKIFFEGVTLWGKKSQKINEETTNDDTEETLAGTNWEYYLDEAISNNNTRLAIRYSYMRMLQLLERNGLIQYRSDKTNYDYYRELSDPQLSLPFRQLSRQYEYAWYGHLAVPDDVYRAYLDTFNELKNRLRST